MADGLYEGKYVIVYWMSRTNGAETKDIPAFRVQGAQKDLDKIGKQW